MNEESTTIQEFIVHLIELRTRVIRAVAAVFVVFVALLPFANKLYTWLAYPLLSKMPIGGHMIATEVTTPFFVPMKVAGLVAFLLALPYVLAQIWGFVAPGLYDHEKRMALPLIISSTLLFYVGMAFAYFAVFPFAFGFFANTAPQGVEMMTDIDKYLSFVISMFLAFGLAFETPVAVVLLVKLGILNVPQLRAARRYVVVSAFVVGAIFTPPDAVSQTLLAIPLWLLYELGILVASRVAPKEEEAEPLKLPNPES
ncbi:twin-arginine translocase subunit TatC [Ferrovum myxofaciens]|uniref:Sec-independent protein translocase protein TatC n=2 Tax=root TaxID=1 RepID=A0A8F3DSK8_9PROT|nr:twin-arginine translocase subunit TatC [Ferrovum myxofaciens]KXW59223.1 Sec-independent protein translocase protein TatC [Ferrovum myxofaciens]MBU6994792.1 twin-arginine translocase subunit TatC [Ferrovum myxofaciens]QKE39769.2 MAG: twin-arginine translocase subunit TatC [Ferrovum myxofaciens]QWY73832.1 MAG: twin-arginine translocase subunit TatC [Ferrovum myxofaciens]QWY76587.1 MAG: twin-arginine translocase subunit TatC [Ferrovum myxofaciens]